MDAAAVVGDREEERVPLPALGNGDVGGLSGPGSLDGVEKKIAEDAHEIVMPGV